MHFKKSNDNQSTILHEGSVPYLTFKKLDQAGVRHGFSTRMGGVSEGMFSTLNLSYNRGDKKEAVDENFRRISEAIGFDHTKLVFSNQIHETRIHKVTKEDCGKVMKDMEVKRKISSQPLDHQSAEVATRLVKMLQMSLKKN